MVTLEWTIVIIFLEISPFFSNFLSACVACPLGQYSPLYNVTCKPCNSGTFANTTALPSCYQCPIGYSSYQESSSCFACPEGTFAGSLGSPTCTSCSGKVTIKTI